MVSFIVLYSNIVKNGLWKQLFQEDRRMIILPGLFTNEKQRRLLKIISDPYAASKFRKSICLALNGSCLYSNSQSQIFQSVPYGLKCQVYTAPQYVLRSVSSYFSCSRVSLSLSSPVSSS